MTTTKKTTALEKLNKFIPMISLLGGIGSIIGFAYYFGVFQKDIETKTFKDPAQREKTAAHINSDYNEVKNYQLMVEQKEMKADLDTAYAYVNTLFKEDRQARKLDSLNSISAIKSRAKRDSSNLIQTKRLDNIEREQRISSNAIQLILVKLEKLDTIQ